MLKQRLWQLRYVEFTNVDKITKFVVACCVLHNMCLDGGDFDVNDLLTDHERKERIDAALHKRLSLAELRQVDSLCPKAKALSTDWAN